MQHRAHSYSLSQSPLLRPDCGPGLFRSCENIAGSGRAWAATIRSEKATRAAYFDVEAGRFIRSTRMARVEAVLLISNSAITTRRIAQLATLADAGEAKTIVDKLNYAYDTSNSSFRIERVASGYRMLTRPELVFWLDRLHKRELRTKLSQSMLETLTMVAYRQPITRADVEAIRGVAAAEMLKQLMERGLVRIAGQDEGLGRPYLYGTTRLFLEMYGLKSLDDMPFADELRRRKEPQPTIDDAAKALLEEVLEDEDPDDEDWDDDDENEEDWDDKEELDEDELEDAA